MKERPARLTIEPFTLEREWAVDGIPVLSAAVTVPLPASAKDPVSRRIRRYYKLQSRAYLRYCEKWLLPQAKTEYQAALAASAPFSCFQASLSYRITFEGNALLSLYIQSAEQTLPGRRCLSRRSDTWSLSAGYPMSLSQFFPPHSAWKRYLLSAAEAEIRRRERAGAARFHSGWHKKLRRSFNAQNYYLTPEGLFFFFPMYAIAPAAEGIPTFSVPFGENGLWQPSQNSRNG